MNDQERDDQSILSIHTNGVLLVRIGIDGEIEYGDGYDPDETARVFWDAIARHAPLAIAAH